MSSESTPPPSEKKATRGGKRAGAGRKAKYGEPTASIALQLPLSLVMELDAEAESESERTGHKVSRSEVAVRRMRPEQTPL